MKKTISKSTKISVVMGLTALVSLSAFAHNHGQHGNKEQGHGQQERAQAHGSHAHLYPANMVVHLRPTRGNEGKFGMVTFERTGDGVKVMAHLEGMPANSTHGFHVHEFGDCSAPDATSAGSHFNPNETQHGARDAEHRHVGDLGNIETNRSGMAHVEFVDQGLTMRGPHSILGRAVVVHEQADDLTSQPVGNAGARVLCGVIGVAKN